MLPADEEAEPVELVGLEPLLLVLLLLHAARAPGITASPVVAASPLTAARRENAPDLAGVEGVSVMATPRGNVQEGSGHSEDRTKRDQNVARHNMAASRCMVFTHPNRYKILQGASRSSWLLFSLVRALSAAVAGWRQVSQKRAFSDRQNGTCNNLIEFVSVQILTW
jgi:hypothetical protein